MTRLLVMGAGLIGLRHINAIRANPDCVLAGVTEPNSDLHTNPETGFLPSIDSVDVAEDGVRPGHAGGLQFQPRNLRTNGVPHVFTKVIFQTGQPFSS